MITISMVGKKCPLCGNILTENEDGDAECLTDDIVVAMRAGTADELDVAAQTENQDGFDSLRIRASNDELGIIYESADVSNE